MKGLRMALIITMDVWGACYATLEPWTRPYPNKLFRCKKQSGEEKKEKSGRQQRRGDFNFFRRRRRRYDGKKRAKHTPVEELVDL